MVSPLISRLEKLEAKMPRMNALRWFGLRRTGHSAPGSPRR